MPNPFRREQDAFRMLLTFMVGAGIVIAVTLVTDRALAGIVVAVLLVCAAAWKLWTDYRRWRAEEAPEGDGDPGEASPRG